MNRHEFEIMIEEQTCNGDCDKCMYGMMDDCHLQCTHVEKEWKEHQKYLRELEIAEIAKKHAEADMSYTSPYSANPLDDYDDDDDYYEPLDDYSAIDYWSEC